MPAGPFILGRESNGMDQPRIQVVLDDAELTPVVRMAIEATGAAIEVMSFAQPPSSTGRGAMIVPESGSNPGSQRGLKSRGSPLLSPGCDHDSSPSRPPFNARLLLTRDAGSVTNGKLSRLIEWCDRDPCATLVLAESEGKARLHTASHVGTAYVNPASPKAGLDSPRPHVPTATANIDIAGRPIAFAAGLSPTDVAARLSGMCLAYTAMQSLRDEVERLRRRENEQSIARNRWTQDLRLAASLQRDLVPTRLPEMSGLELRTIFRPADAVGGDIYDVFRLSETQIGFWLADATGHDVSAGMMAALVRGLFQRHAGGRRPLRPGSSRPDSNAVIPTPAEVLAGVNADLLDLEFSECQFVTAVYGTYDESDRLIRLSRAGAPYPLLSRQNAIRDGAGISRGILTEPLRTAGPMLGVADALVENFAIATVELEPGDGILLHTDGLEAIDSDSVILPNAHSPRWANHEDVFDGLDRINRRLGDSPLQISDDVTVLALRGC